MILKRVFLHPFAGFSKHEIEFTPKVNVVCGPNDIGKSTLYRAIESVLFLPTKVRANSLEGRELRRMIPIGGDFARVTLEFESNGSYRLEKNWGPDAYTRLTLPDGIELTVPERVEEVLRGCLPATPSTFRTVLFSGQNALEKTVDDLTQNGEALHSLGDVLRRTVDQTDGVSIDRLGAVVKARLEDTFLNWDIANRSPKKNRGIENPWDRQGPVLMAYYAKERLRQSLADTLALETILGDKIKTLNERMDRQSRMTEFFEKNEKIVDGVMARQTLQLRLDRAESEVTAITRDLSAWVQAESDRKSLEPDVKRLELLVSNLGGELREARAEIGRKSLLERFAKMEAAKEVVDFRRKVFNELPALPPADLNRLRTQWNLIERLKASLSAAKLQLELSARKPIEILVSRDLESEKQEELASGRKLLLRAGGKIRIRNENFELTVTSGDGDREKLEDSLRRETDAIGGLLTRMGVQSLEEAQERSEKWVAAANSLRTAESALSALLAGEPFERIQEQARKAETARAGRDPEAIERDFAAASSQLTARTSDLKTCLHAISQWKTRYQTPDTAALTTLMVKKAVEQETLKNQILALPPLPEGVGEVALYLARFKRCQTELPPLAETIRILSGEVVEMKGKLPEQSAQDFDRQLRDARFAFESEIRKGEALLRVSEALKNLGNRSEDLYRNFQIDLEQTVQALSQGKYFGARLEGALPVEFSQSNGTAIPYAWLSSGTKDSFALSLRLSMAKAFLKGSQGFVLLDDPMVAMDPRRQETAAQMIRQFGEDVQLIVFTCHPDHARLFSGNLIPLGNVK